MKVYSVYDPHWFHSEHRLKVAGNMVLSYSFASIREFILKHDISHLDLSGEGEGFLMQRMQLMHGESLDINNATALLVSLEDTPTLVLNLAENIQMQGFPDTIEEKIQQLDEFAEALKKTQIHTLNLTRCSFFELDDSRFNDDSELFQYDDELISSFASKLKGSNVTQIIGLEHPELSKVLKENMAIKIERMIALGQGVCNYNMNADVLGDIVSFMPESKSSGAVDEKEGSRAEVTAKTAFWLSRDHKQQNVYWWEQTGSILRNETIHLSDDMRVLKRAIEYTRYYFFKTALPALSKIEQPSCAETEAPSI